MAKLSQEELLAQFENLTLIELSEFVKAFEEKFDVTAAAAVAAAPPSPPPRPRPRPSRTSSTSSSRVPARRRSRSSRSCVSSPRSV